MPLRNRKWGEFLPLAMDTAKGVPDTGGWRAAGSDQMGFRPCGRGQGAQGFRVSQRLTHGAVAPRKKKKGTMQP